MILPSLTYSAETWALTTAEEKEIAITQRAIERRIHGISKRDRIRNEELRERSKIKDAVEDIRLKKLKWAGHVARMPDYK